MATFAATDRQQRVSRLNLHSPLVTDQPEDLAFCLTVISVSSGTARWSVSSPQGRELGPPPHPLLAI